MTNLGRARVNQRGFTLAELLVAMAIVGLVMAGLMTLLKKGNESYLAGANQVEAQAAVRAALERMTQEIREAGYAPCTGPPTAPPPAPCQNWGGAIFDAITTTTPTSFTIQNDWDADAAINWGGIPGSITMAYSWGNVQRGEQITYSIAGGNLSRLESGPAGGGAQVVLQNVAQAGRGTDCAGAALVNPPIFQYCDANGIVTGVAANIRTIVVNIQVGVQGQTPGSWQTGAVQVAMSDRIRLRNR